MDILYNLQHRTYLDILRLKKKTRGLCALVIVDVKSTLNTVPWMEIMKALEYLKVPKSLTRLLALISKTGGYTQDMGNIK